MFRQILLSAVIFTALGNAAHAACDLDKLDKEISGRLLTANVTEKEMEAIATAGQKIPDLIKANKIDEACVLAEKVKAMLSAPANAAAVPASAHASSTAAENLSSCVRTGEDSFKSVTLVNGCTVPVRVTFRLASHTDRNQWYELTPGQDSPVGSQEEVATGGGVVWVACPTGQKALEGDGSGPWYGRTGASVCK